MRGKRFYRNTSILAISLVTISFFSADGHKTDEVFANFEGYNPSCIQDEMSGDSDSDGGSSSSNSGEAGDWKDDGTKSNEIAEDMWDYWKDKGFSGAAIAGVMGNVAHEGGFDIPDRAEGNYGGDAESDGIAAGNIPETQSNYPTGETGKKEGGAGHYQFTPYTKFAEEGDSKWESTEEQSDFVWSSEVEGADWLEEYIELDDVEEAVDMWFSEYERGAELDSAKIESGKDAYETFGGSDVEADSAAASAVDTANDGEEEKKKKEAEKICEEESDSEGSSSSGSSDLVSTAEGLLGYFDYVMVHGEENIGSVDDPDKDGETDCSGFIWLVFKQAGYKAPDNMEWFTGSMEEDARGEEEYLEKISADEAKEGDIVIVTADGKTGHTALLKEDWKDDDDKDNETEIIQMGGISMDGVSEDAFNSSFKSLVEGDHETTFAKAKKD